MLNMFRHIWRHIWGVMHVTGSCTLQAVLHPGRKITHCSARLASPQSAAPWWGLGLAAIIGGVGIAIGHIYQISPIEEVGRTMTDGSLALLFGRGTQVYNSSRRSS